VSDLRAIKEVVGVLQEKIEHLEAETVAHCCECDEKIHAGEADQPWCNKCGAPVHCDDCGGDVTEGRCTGCHDKAIEESIEKAKLGNLPSCEECDSVIEGKAVHHHCHRETLAAARTNLLTRYPHVGMNRTGPMPDQILTFLTMTLDACCQGRGASKLCAQCSDAAYVRSLYDVSLGEIRA
jgi:hypothetical protein